MRIIDTGDKILTGDNHPQLKIGNKCYIVDDRKSTWDKIQAIQNDDSIEEKEIEIFKLALGEEAVKELVTDELTVGGYTALSFYVMSAITGEDYEELRRAAKNAKN
ncbi:MAG: hypothetical protein U0K91_03650 [Acutalibacteraceae bacterium]|nr:hypothetical protein [Acutalibacteraceae bacterium]